MPLSDSYAATEIVAVDQPNSFCSGSSKADGVDIALAVVSSVKNVTPTTTVVPHRIGAIAHRERSSFLCGPPRPALLGAPVWLGWLGGGLPLPLRDSWLAGAFTTIEPQA